MYWKAKPQKKTQKKRDKMGGDSDGEGESEEGGRRRVDRENLPSGKPKAGRLRLTGTFVA